MKKFTFFLLCFVTLSLLTISCKKDKKSDESVTPKKSYVKMGDVQYDLSKGIYSIEYDSDNVCYEVFIFLYTGFENVYLYDHDSFDGDGTGSGIMIWLNSTKNEIIPKFYVNGSDDLYDCEEIVYFKDGVIDTEVFNYYGESNDDGVGGVTVSKNGDNYEITLNFEGYVYHDGQGNENVNISGYYYGKLTQ